MYTDDLKERAKANNNFRTVLHTGTHSQIVAMSIPVAGDIGEEVHPATDQMLFVVEGKAEAIINGESRILDEHDVVFVPAGAKHNIKNIDDEALKLFTVYAPPGHPDGTVHATKEEAEAAEKQY